MSSSPLRRPVEGSIGRLKQTCERSVAIRATGLQAKVIKRRQGAARGDFEERAVATSATEAHRAVEVSIGSREKSGLRLETVRTVEAMQCSEGAGRREFEDRSVVVCAADVGSSIEVSVGILNHACVGQRAVGQPDCAQKL